MKISPVTPLLPQISDIQILVVPMILELQIPLSHFDVPGDQEWKQDVETSGFKNFNGL